MHQSDILIIVAESLPLDQAFDLVHWWCYRDLGAINHPSVDWWITKHATDIWNLPTIWLRRPQ